MTDNITALYEERLGRYQAAIALEPTDRIPIAAGTNYFAEVYSGNTNQETIYHPEKWLEAEFSFVRDFPEIDVLRDNRFWGPLLDTVGLMSYRLPGRDLGSKDPVQFVEKEYMLARDYDELIRSPIDFLFNCWMPRVFEEFRERGSVRSYLAFLKGGMAQMMWGQTLRNRGVRLQSELGMPQPMTGFFLAPFDVLGDSLRGMRGLFMDCFRQPDKVIAACDVLVDEMVNLALGTADPLKRYPIFVPTHKPTFLSSNQFDRFYWPSFKKTCEILIEAGYSIRAYLEGNWGAHWHHMLELPKGKVLCDIDSQGDIFRAKTDIGHHQCIAGGIADSQFVLGTPAQMREHVKHLCETLGEGGGYMISGGCNFPYATKKENFRAMIDAVLEFGVYDANAKPRPRPTDPTSARVAAVPCPKMVTPWDAKKSEIGGVLGDEEMIRGPWETLEGMAYLWLWQWVL